MRLNLNKNDRTAAIVGIQVLKTKNYNTKGKKLHHMVQITPVHWNSVQKVPFHLKSKIHKTVVMLVALYGNENWSTRANAPYYGDLYADM